MFPDPPYHGFSWHLTQHMGVVSDTSLRAILSAAAIHGSGPDPAKQINEFLVRAKVLTANVRSDSGRADAWRDYQQVLSELGLMYSTEVEQSITLTTIGLAYLDKMLTFGEVITLQCLRYQYPNGHKVTISSSLRSVLAKTEYGMAPNLMVLQQDTGVQVRPAVLVWQVLRALDKARVTPVLRAEEISTYLMRCGDHADTSACVEAIVRASRTSLALPPTAAKLRNAQDWLKFLRLSPIFSGSAGADAYVEISEYGRSIAEHVDAICEALVDCRTFWKPDQLKRADRLSWYEAFGAIDLRVGLIPRSEPVADDTASKDAVDPLDDRPGSAATPMPVHLREFSSDGLDLPVDRSTTGIGETNLSYDAAITPQRRNLHDRMVGYISWVCRGKGAGVWHDPNTLDLLVTWRDHEFLVEVKSVTPANFIARLRYAIGQVYQYDYMRASQSDLPRRKVIAVTASIHEEDWYITFLNDGVDADLLSLRNRRLCIHSKHAYSRELFTPLPTSPIFGV